jgi:NADH:ubiquinone oxidoreductase subunit C
MTAVHTDPAFVLYYQFAGAECTFRVMLSAPADLENRARSLTPLFPGLQWHEREARDMFGIIFDNHPDLRPLFICDEDRDLHPLRKAAGSLKTPEQLGLTARPDTSGEEP